MNEPTSPSPESLSLERRERVDRVCDEFERKWKTGEKPRIEEYIERAEQGDRQLLLQELVALELEFRSNVGEEPRPEEYRTRFPNAIEVVDAAWSAHKPDPLPTTVDHAPNQDTPGSEAQNQPPPQEPDPVPERIGRYQVQSVLGKGGFAFVYLGHDTQLDRHVALKVPRPDRFRDEADLDRFVDEARKAAQLEHPRIVRIHDVQREPGSVYIVQQYIDGQDLAKYARSNRLTPRQVAELMIGISEAVGYAHQRGFVHRDLKPGNILVSSLGETHVADFGLALHAGEQRGHRGEVAGTYAYMSPEQVRGEAHRLDGRSDIWSLGVILYELLTGRRPFAGDDRSELFDEIKHREPRPLREINPDVPRELSRICLACLAKRKTDRYETTADLVDDLRHWLEGKPSMKVAVEEEEGASDEAAPLKIVPKGLRSYEAADADFFLELLPGPRDRERLPKSIRFWKTQIEEQDADATFAVGVLYGPSGCGKSSLVKAGLLPRLAEDVLPLYVEATGTDTEVRLLKRLRKGCPGLPEDASLSEVFAELRSGHGSRGRKVLVVLDQFEQWLHACPDYAESQLVSALRQCDGSGIQCLVLVRADFWLSVTRFMQALEVPMLEAHNSAVVDLFDCDHARRVLTAFGRAYGKLPESPNEHDEQQMRFIDRAVEGLAEDGKVICVRLAVFAEMMKGKSWTEASLDAIGGTAGVGVTFLEETFSAKTAPPTHRFHQQAARGILKALLPEQGSDIKGQMKSHDELLEASGYANRHTDLQTVLGILDSELRLITPTEPDEPEGEVADVAVEDQGSYYQLTHDYLVPSLREWLTRKQKETRRGRAELRLAERSALWNAKPENRHLSSWWEYLSIRLLTKRQNWTEPQRQMMARAGRVHGLRWGVALLFAVVFGIAVERTVSTVRHRNLTERTETAVAAMSTSRGILVPRAIEDLQDLPRDMVFQELTDRFADSPESEKLSLAYALSDFDDVKIDYLVSQIRTASKDEVDNLATALGPERKDAVAALRLASDESTADLRHKARLAIIALYLGDVSLARDMCQIRTDPSQRTELIHTLPKWHGNVAKLAAVLDESVDAPLHSGVCLGVGSIAAEEVTSEMKQAWQPVLLQWYVADADTGTHSAARWTLNQWQVLLPEIPSSRDPVNGKQWYVNSLNMTMLRIPEGKLSRRDELDRDSQPQEVRLKRPFFLSDREISVAMFRQFIDGVDSPHDNWEGADSSVSPTPDHPVQRVNWSDAVMFCNWLSHKEQLPVCYEKHAEDWQPVADADGYRLPTEAEWEYACRARSETDFTFGNDRSLLSSYCVCDASKAQRCGSKLPNAWGLFDMHGNVYEWCQDWYGEYENAAEVVDPAGPSKASFRVDRGGGWYVSARYCRSAYRSWFSPVIRGNDLGFRVARGLSSE